MSAAHEEIIRVLQNVAPRKLKSSEIYDAGSFENPQVVAMALHDMHGPILTRDGERGKFQYGLIDGADPQQWLSNRKTRAKPDPVKQPGPVRIVHTVADRAASASPAVAVKEPARPIAIPQFAPAANERTTIAPTAPAANFTALHNVRQLHAGAIDDLLECAEAHTDEKIKALAHRVRLLEQLRDSFRGAA
jgi:hypothetical protein